MNKGSGRALSPTSVGLGGYREVRVGWPRVAVCLAAYNGRAWLQEQLQSILQQEGVEVRIFVSVDRSDDGTEAWVSEYCRAEGRVLLLPTGERFGGAAPNFFRLLKEVDFSQFEYVSLADQDDIWYPDKLRRAISMLEESKADCYSSNVMAFWEDGTQRLVEQGARPAPVGLHVRGGGPRLYICCAAGSGRGCQGAFARQTRSGGRYRAARLVHLCVRSHERLSLDDRCPTVDGIPTACIESGGGEQWLACLRLPCEKDFRRLGNLPGSPYRSGYWRG